MIVIEQAVQLVDDWKGKQIDIFPLSGGLTNTNYRVEVNSVPYVIRIPGEGSQLLAIDRANEYHNAVAAAKTGISPKVVYYFPENNIMVLEFLEGKTMSNLDLNQSGMPSRIAKSLRKLHAGPGFLRNFNMFDLTRLYLETVKDNDVRIPDGYFERMSFVQRIEKAMSARPATIVPCHNDLLAENYIDDGEELRIIDFEYSGNNDPCFELGNTCQELQYNDDQIAELCTTYFGELFRGKIARMRLNMIMSDVGWGLWAAIQSKISTIKYDFWGWALERWSRACQKMDSLEFNEWINEVISTD
jgi:thiamine kinase-like enzyme